MVKTINSRPRARYDSAKVVADMALKGWNATDLARATDLSPQSISQFLRGKAQSARTANKIATALGHSVRRYFSHVEAA